MRPVFQIRADGADVTAVIADRLISIQLSDNAGLVADELAIEIDDRDGRIELPRRGVELTLALGTRERGLTAMGRFVVESLRGGGPEQRITIAAKSADLTGAIRAPRSYAWTGATLGTIAGDIAARHGLTARVASGLAAHAYDHVAQTAESDLNLITRLATDLDATAKIAEGTLSITPSARGTNASGAALPAATVLRRHLTTWVWEIGERSEYRAVAAPWGDRAGARQPMATAGSGEPRLDIRRVYATEAEARAAADARLGQLARGRLTLNATCAGFRADIAAGAPLDISGLRTGIDGAWVAKRVQHRLDTSGLVTSFEAEPPGQAEEGA